MVQATQDQLSLALFTSPARAVPASTASSAHEPAFLHTQSQAQLVIILIKGTVWGMALC